MSDAEDEKKNLPFHEMELDERILKAIAKLGWIDPTLIQVIYFYLMVYFWTYAHPSYCPSDLLARGFTAVR